MRVWYLLLLVTFGIGRGRKMFKVGDIVKDIHLGLIGTIVETKYVPCMKNLQSGVFYIVDIKGENKKFSEEDLVLASRNELRVFNGFDPVEKVEEGDMAEDTEPKFKVGDKVKIIGGRWVDHKGVVNQVYTRYVSSDVQMIFYDILIDGHAIETFTDELLETLPKNEENDNVNHPAHYTFSNYDCIDIMEDVYGKEAVMNFCTCNTFKYLWRSEHKNGLEDLKKARWYLNKLIDLKENDNA